MPKITVQLTDDEHKLFVNAKMNRKERSLQSFLISAANILLASGGGGEPVKVPSEAPQRHGANVQWHEKLDLIFSEGTEDEQTLIKKNLNWATNDIRTRQGKKASRRKTG